jgi:hypothetical protein
MTLMLGEPMISIAGDGTDLGPRLTGAPTVPTNYNPLGQLQRRNVEMAKKYRVSVSSILHNSAPQRGSRQSPELVS